MAGPSIKPAGIKQLSTVHENFVQSIEELFVVWNGDNPDVVGGYNETTKCIQQFLAQALEKNKTVRVLGGNWSWTKVGFTKDWMVSTTRLNRMKRLLPIEVVPQYPFVPDELLFCNKLRRRPKVNGRTMRTIRNNTGYCLPVTCTGRWQ